MQIDISIDNSGDSKATFIYLVREAKCAIEAKCALVEIIEFIDSVNVYVKDFGGNFTKESFTNRNLAKAYVYNCITAMVAENK